MADGGALDGLVLSFLAASSLWASSSEEEDDEDDEEEEDEEEDEEELSLSLSLLLLLSCFFWAGLSSSFFFSLGGLLIFSGRWLGSGRSLLNFSTGLDASRCLSDNGRTASSRLRSSSRSPPLPRFRWSLSFSRWRPLAPGERETGDKESRD